VSPLSVVDRRRITEDWAREFPELAVWKPLVLLRRIGPVLQGVTLNESSGDDYLPTAHVHALTRRFPTISMTLPTELRTAGGVPDPIRAKFHRTSVVVEAAERLREASPLRFEGSILANDLVAVYQKGINKRRRPGWPMSVNEVEDQVLLPAAVGRADLVETGLTFARLVTADWPPGALERWGRSDDWLEEVAALAQRREELEATVEAEVVAHRLGSLPVVPLM
jgi:hypothetical protein